jgi:hypothetical protein
MGLWSVIVYGRTKEADYRFLAIPDDFGEEEQDWARKYIRGTTVYPEKLPGSPRWSLFKNYKHCVFGVTCMVRELTGSKGKYDMTKDTSGRPIHIFFGHVAKINKYFNSLKILSYLEELDFFKSHYLLTSSETLWHLKDYQLINREIDKYPYKFRLELNYSKVAESRGDFNSSFFQDFISSKFSPCLEGENRAFVWPDTPENRHNVWENCCRLLKYQNTVALSLCLGLPEKQDVLQGPFSNATASDATQHQKLTKRKSKVINYSPKITETNNKEVSKITNNSSSSLADRELLILILLIAIIFFLIFLFIWKPLIFAILISLLIAFWLGRMFEKNQNRSSKKSK